MDKSRKNLFLIGLSAVVALVVLFAGIEYLKGINVFGSSNHYYATYTDVTGLSVSAPVNANGFKVGQVRSIEYLYNNPGHVRVDLALDTDLKVPNGTEAVLVSDLLGTASITLLRPQSTDYAKSGSELAARIDGGMMESVSGELLPTLASIMPKVDSILTALNVVVSNPALQNSVTRLDAITNNIEQMTQTLNSASRQLPTVMGNASVLSANAVRMSAHLDSLSAQLAQLPLNETVGNVKALTASLNDLANDLRDPNSSLGLLMNDPKLYNGMNSAVNDLDSLFIDIKAHPKRYLKFSVF
jgi:phospholipid/cholesterol/gamma-HCH transport system substrate-binding protein